MLTILSHKVINNQFNPFTRIHQVELDLHIDLPTNDPAFAEGGTLLSVTLNKENFDIISYAFIPKNNPSHPTISVSLTEDEEKGVVAYCKQAVANQ